MTRHVGRFRSTAVEPPRFSRVCAHRTPSIPQWQSFTRSEDVGPIQQTRMPTQQGRLRPPALGRVREPGWPTRCGSPWLSIGATAINTERRDRTSSPRRPSPAHRTAHRGVPPSRGLVTSPAGRPVCRGRRAERASDRAFRRVRARPRCRVSADRRSGVREGQASARPQANPTGSGLADIAVRMPAALDDYGSPLVEVDGISPGLGVGLIGQLSSAHLSSPS